MKVLNLAKDDIAYVYNISTDSYSELQVVKHNEDGTTRFRCTGNEFHDVPDGKDLITNVNMMVQTFSDGTTERYIVDTKGLTQRLRQLKAFIKTFLSLDFGG